MVKLRMERHNSYPETAKNRQIEGQVTITFTITPGGDVGSVGVMKTSGHRALDLTALRAVQDATPLPKPPRRIFRGHVHVKLPIIFWLT
jgi:protein TonB